MSAGQNNDEKFYLKLVREMDLAMWVNLDLCFMEDESSHIGVKAKVAVSDRQAQFGRFGSRKLPRAARCLKGLQDLAPGRSRLGCPLAVWLASAVQMACREHRQKDRCLPLMLNSCALPSEFGRLMKHGPVRPRTGTTGYLSLLVSPSEEEEDGKIGLQEASLLLGSRLMILICPLLESIKAGDQNSRAWDFLTCVRGLKLAVLPYQALNSEASSHRIRRQKFQEGSWQSEKPVARNERSTRLAATWSKIPLEVQHACKQAARSIRDVMLGQGRRHFTFPRLAVQRLEETMLEPN